MCFLNFSLLAFFWWRLHVKDLHLWWRKVSRNGKLRVTLVWVLSLMLSWRSACNVYLWLYKVCNHDCSWFPRVVSWGGRVLRESASVCSAGAFEYRFKTSWTGPFCLSFCHRFLGTFHSVRSSLCGRRRWSSRCDLNLWRLFSPSLNVITDVVCQVRVIIPFSSHGNRLHDVSVLPWVSPPLVAKLVLHPPSVSC